MSDEEKRSPEPPFQTPLPSQEQEQPNQGEEKKDSEEEFMYPTFLTVRHSDIIGSDGTYFWVQREGQGPTWAMDGWRIVWNPKKRRWNLLNPYDTLVGRTVKRGIVRIPPTNKKWCTRITEHVSFQVSALEVTEVQVYREGEEVLARFKNRWYLGTIFRVHNDDTVDLWWHDKPNLKTSNVPFSYLKKSRRVSIKVKFENFENVSRLARMKIPLSWKVRKLRNLIGCKTVTNFEEINLYLDKSAALPLSKKIGDLCLGSGACLTAKKEAFEIFKKEDPVGTWSQGEKCEYFCADKQWRKGTIKAIHINKMGITADVKTVDGDFNSVHVSMWHKHLRSPGTGLQAPLPPGTRLGQFQVGEQVMVTFAKGYTREATITTALPTAEGERPKWKVTYSDEYEEDMREYRSDEFERINNGQQCQVMPPNLNMLQLDSDYIRIFDSIEQIDDCKDSDSLQKTLKNIIDKFPAEGDNNAINALVSGVLTPYQGMDPGTLFTEQREICVQLSALMPNYRDAEVLKTLPKTSNFLEPIPNPNAGREDGKYHKGARLSKTLNDRIDQDIVPKGSKVIQVDKMMVDHLDFDQILKKVKEAYSKTSIVEFVFNIGGTDSWRLWFKSQGRRQQSVPGTYHRESVEMNPVDAPRPSIEKFCLNDLVHVLDGTEKKIAIVVGIDVNNMYTITYIPQDKMEDPRQVSGHLLAKDPNDLVVGAQTQLQPTQHPLSKDAIALSIYSHVSYLSGDYEKKEDVPLEKVRRQLENDYPNDNYEQVLGSTLEEFFENGDQYEFKRGNDKSQHTVRLIAKFYRQERELKNSSGLAEAASNMLQSRPEFHPPMQIPGVKAEISEEKLARLEQTANSMGIYPEKQDLLQALESDFRFESQISYLLEKCL